MAKPIQPNFIHSQKDYNKYLREYRTKWMQATRDRERLLIIKEFIGKINVLLGNIKEKNATH